MLVIAWVFSELTQLDSAWKWPKIPGIETFKGDIFHTAAYKEGYDLKGKKVAVVGSGSSGVQVCASIYPEVEKLYTWVRSPTWITAAFGQQFAGESGRNFDCKCFLQRLTSCLEICKLTTWQTLMIKRLPLMTIGKGIIGTRR